MNMSIVGPALLHLALLDPLQCTVLTRLFGNAVDDCWSVQGTRNATTGQIIPDPTKFPDGISGLADQIHSMGLKLGIYSSRLAPLPN